MPRQTGYLAEQNRSPSDQPGARFIDPPELAGDPAKLASLGTGQPDAATSAIRLI